VATPAGYGTAGYGGGYAYPVAAQKRTNPMAIASMTTSIVGLPLLMCYGLGLPVSIVGAILGHIAKRQIRERDEQGDGMALAGIIMGWIGTGLAVLGVGALIVFIAAFARTAHPLSAPTRVLASARSARPSAPPSLALRPGR
jgi:hypothetical protein